METSCSYTDKTMYVSSDQQRIINKVRKLAEQHPDEVTVIRYPEQNDGCIYASMPSERFRISPPIKREMTDEQRQASAERLRLARESRTNSAVSSEHTE